MATSKKMSKKEKIAAIKAAKAASRNKKNAPAGPDRPGITKKIIEILLSGSAKKPIPKPEIWERLKKAFPERDERKLKVTLNGQLLYNLDRRKGIQVGRNENSFYLSQHPSLPLQKKGKNNGK